MKNKAKMNNRTPREAKEATKKSQISQRRSSSLQKMASTTQQTTSRGSGDDDEDPLGSRNLENACEVSDTSSLKMSPQFHFARTSNVPIASSISWLEQYLTKEKKLVDLSLPNKDIVSQLIQRIQHVKNLKPHPDC